MTRATESPRVMGFESERFYADLKRIASIKGMSMENVAHMVGMDGASLARMRTRGAVPDGINLAALCKWSGLHAADYSIERPVHVRA